MLTVLTPNKDRRLITPAEILADPTANEGSPDLAAREALADDVSGRIVALYCGREPWRQTDAEQLSGIDAAWLRPSRYPIEGTPAVWLGSDLLATGLYRVTGRCRHELRRDPNVSYAIRATREPLLANRSLDLEPWNLSGELADFRLPNYVAGYVPPGSIGERANSTAYAPGGSTAYGDAQPGWIRRPGTASDLLFECTAGGTSAASAPTFPLTLAEWSPGFTYAATQWTAPPTSSLVFEPTTPGTSDSDDEPTWPTAAGSTVAMEVTDGTVTWTGRVAYETPRPLRKAALLLARITRAIDLDGECKKHEEKMRAVISMLQGAC